MKMIMLVCVLISLGNIAQAQKCKAKDVPAAVKSKFAILYPGIKVEKWEKEEDNYEAEFDKNKKEMTTTFTSTGDFIEAETSIKVAELPRSIKDYVVKNYPRKKIHEASRIVDATGIVTFEAEVKKIELFFDSNGSFIRAEQ
ncbi:MAG: PepSY-like domain-containing protein, partial [Saprospiraceae bacterium]